jgi:hypothetical protein
MSERPRCEGADLCWRHHPGRITIGKGASIGGNVRLTRSVPASGCVTQARAPG